MAKDGKTMACITGRTVRNLIETANQIGIAKEDIISMFALGEQIYLIYYR